MLIQVLLVLTQATLYGIKSLNRHICLLYFIHVHILSKDWYVYNECHVAKSCDHVIQENMSLTPIRKLRMCCVQSTDYNNPFSVNMMTKLNTLYYFDNIINFEIKKIQKNLIRLMYPVIAYKKYIGLRFQLLSKAEIPDTN